MILRFSFFLLGWSQFVRGGTFNWDVGWVTAAPDGFSRPVMGVNGQWPPPIITAKKGERITVNVNNQLGNQTTSVHWHGLRMLDSPNMDGASGVSQCPQPPGSSLTYSFIADSPGTYWYHSHNMGQYPDGLRNALIIDDTDSPFEFEEEFTITLSDWYHTQALDLIRSYQSPSNTNGAEPVPDSILMNDGSPANFNVVAGKTYLFRIINIGAFPSFFFNIDGHTMSIVEVDGVYTEPSEARTLLVGAAQRYGVLVTVANGANTNFGISAMVDTSMFATPYNGSLVTSGTMVVNSAFGTPQPRDASTLNSTIMPPTDDIDLVPLDKEPLLGPVDKQIIMNFDRAFINGIPRAIINNVTYLMPKVPSLYTAISATPDVSLNPAIYGSNTIPFVVNYNETVEIVLNNLTPEPHPWHLHGHKFQVVARSEAGAYKNGQQYTGQNLPAVPMKRDVVGVHDYGWVVLRFKADNPGVQLFHCHIEWHVEAGLTATIIEAPDRISRVWAEDHINACKAQGMPWQGNAAGDTTDWTDLTGANTQVTIAMVAQGAEYPASKKKKRTLTGRYAPLPFRERMRRKLSNVFQDV